MIYRIVEAVLSILLIYLVLPQRGLAGFVEINIGLSIFTCFLKLQRLIKVTRLEVQTMNWFVYPALCAAAAGMTARVFVIYLIPYGAPLIFKVIMGSMMTLGLYTIGLELLRNITEEEWKAFKIKRKVNLN